MRKYHVFALKAIKSCVEQLNGRSQSSHILLAAMACSQAIGHDRVDNMSDMLCVEKLVFHLARCALKLGNEQIATECCCLIQDRLQKRKEETSAEVIVLLRSTSSVLWRVSTSGEEAVNKACALGLKRRAIEMLLPDVKSCAEHAIKTDSAFIQASRGQTDLACLCNFHCELLSHLTWSSKLTGQLSCAAMSSLHHWLLLAVRACIRSKKGGQGRDLLDKADLTRSSHRRHCRREHRTHVFQQMLLQLVLELQSTPATSSFTCLSVETLRTCAGLVDHSLEDSLQLLMTQKLMHELVMAVRDQLEKSPGNNCFFTQTNFSPLKRLLLGYIKCLDIGAACPQEAAKGMVDRKTQLVTMTIINRILLHLLQAGRVDEGGSDKCESPQCQVTPAPCDTHHPKLSLVNECVPLLCKSREVLVAGCFPAPEYRWLGITAYNMGVLVHQIGLHLQAAQVLEISCQLLVHWCRHSEGETALEKAGFTDQVRVW